MGLNQKLVLLTFMALSASVILGANLFTPTIITEILSLQNPHWDKTKLDGEASTFKSFQDGLNALVALFFLPTIGALSDVYGRKKLLIVAQMAQILFIGCVFASYHYKNLWLMYASSGFYFCVGTQLLAIAYMSDVSKDDKEKSRNFGFILASFMTGSIVGALILGFVGTKFGLFVAILTLMGISCLTYLFLLLVFRESKQFYEHKKPDQKFSIRRGNPFSSLSYLLTVSPYVTTLVVMYVIVFISISDSLTTGVLYTTQRYNWNSFMMGANQATIGVVGIIWQTLGVWLLLKKFTKEHILVTALFLSVAVHFMLGFAWKGWMYISTGAAGGFNVVSFPIIQALISAKIPREKQGIAFGGITSLSSIATFVGALATENVFAFCLDGRSFFSCPGTAFYFCSTMFLINAIIALVLFRVYPPTPSSPSFDEKLPYTSPRSPNISINGPDGADEYPSYERAPLLE